MTPSEALAQCEATVRRFDPDRYFATLFAPASARPRLFALYAFQYELERINEIARESMMAEIRLQWWRDAAGAARRGEAPQHPVAIGLAEIFARTSPPMELFEQLIDAYTPDRLPVVTDNPDFEAYAEATSATVMRLGVCLLGEGVASDDIIREAGVAYGLVRILSTLPFFASRSTACDPGTANLAIDKLSNFAEQHLNRARTMRVPKGSFAVLLPAALVPSHLARAARIRDPLRERITISPLRRQLVLLRAALRGRL